MLREIIQYQKNERDKLLSANYLPRHQKLDITSGLINVIIGPRRAGKSFFGLHYLKNNNFGYINFDDERLVNLSNYDEIISNINSVYSNPEILFFDEIQNLEGWELFVNRLARNGKKIVITGSNSNLLSGELSTHLTGRNSVVNIFPFSFNELLNASELSDETTQKDIFYTLLNTGGYPEIITKGIESIDYLKMLFRDTIYKDIVIRYKPRDPVMVEKLATMMVSNSCSETSIRNLSKIVKYNERTVSKYLLYLLNTMMFFQIPKFSFKLKEQLSSYKKTYLIDNGFINSIAFNVSQNRGKRLENIVAIEILRKISSENKKVFYWKKNYEVDFVIQSGNSIEELIQVSVNIENPKTLNREKRSLLEASKELDCDNLTIITENQTSIDTFNWYGNEKKIRLISAINWMKNG
ncbi:MAG: ATP-binding protein [Melioribacteraceae bacterium]|nr:ATP-binding protein [Melioribacteraceae bacterium]